MQLERNVARSVWLDVSIFATMFFLFVRSFSVMVRCTGFPPVDSQWALESYRVAGPRDSPMTLLLEYSLVSLKRRLKSFKRQKYLLSSGKKEENEKKEIGQECNSEVIALE